MPSLHLGLDFLIRPGRQTEYTLIGQLSGQFYSIISDVIQKLSMMVFVLCFYHMTLC